MQACIQVACNHMQLARTLYAIARKPMQVARILGKLHASFMQVARNSGAAGKFACNCTTLHALACGCMQACSLQPHASLHVSAYKCVQVASKCLLVAWCVQIFKQLHASASKFMQVTATISALFMLLFLYSFLVAGIRRPPHPEHPNKAP